MADDNNQRPYRTTEPRANPSAASASGNDPLAELARLIGQTDPFAEFGRDNARRAAPAETPTNWAPQPAPPAYAPPTAEPRAPATNLFAATPQSGTPPTQPYGAPRYNAAPYAAGSGVYRTGSEIGAYAAAPAHGEDYGDEPYFQGGQQPIEDEDVYDDAPRPHRRMGIIVIAGVFALAVVGTAGAIGYRAIFGSSGSHAPPPVIKADTTPSKVTPSAGKDTQSSKLITDRVGGGQDEKMVSREEQPVDVKDKAALSQMAAGQDQTKSAPLAPAMGSGIVTSEPKKIHTITIRPDQVGLADTGGSAPVQVAPTAPPAAKPIAPPSRANVPPAVAEPTRAPAEPEPRPAEAAPPTVHRTATTSNAPLSLTPGASAPTRAASTAPPAQPARAAAQPASGSGGYAVQVSSQRSEADAEAAFRNMQAKFPNQLGGKKPIIHRVDLGSKGIYFRAMVGPFANSAEASELCSSLKSAGGQCIIQKI